jgi:hypothetical protein
MPKHKDETLLQDLPGQAGSLIGLLLENKKERDAAIQELTTGGPRHKQLYSHLLLERMRDLIKVVEDQTGEKFKMQEGIDLTSHKDGYDVKVPLLLENVSRERQDAIAEALSHSPAHEIIAFNSLLQGIEWCIKNIPEAGK